MLIAELVILCILFWGICYLNTGSNDKNIKSYASYPDEVQEMIKKNPALQAKIKVTSPVVSFVSNILVFGIVLFIFGLFVKADGFMANFINLLILGQCLNAFAVFLLSFFVGTRRRAVSGVGCCSPPANLDFSKNSDWR